MAEKLWTSYDSQSQLTFSDKLLVSCSNETKNTTMNDIYNYICSSSGSTGDYQYRINANLVGGIPVTSNTPNDGAILQYNSTYQRWDLIYLTNAGKIRDINVSLATPTDGQVLVYSESGSQYYPADIGGTYTLPTASTTELGGVKIDGTTITIDANGVVSATVGANTWSTITGKPFTSFGTSISVVDGVADVADDGHNHIISNVDGLQDALDGTVATVEGKGLSTEDYTTAEKTKLGTVAENANNYTLPTASTSTLGGVKVDGTTITINNGVISSSGGGGGGGGSDELWYPTYDAVTGDLSWAKSDSSTTPASAHIKGADGADGAAGAYGADGVSAYSSVQLGGYTDTEAAFYADLAAMQGLDAALEALL